MVSLISFYGSIPSPYPGLCPHPLPHPLFMCLAPVPVFVYVLSVLINILHMEVCLCASHFLSGPDRILTECSHLQGSEDSPLAFPAQALFNSYSVSSPPFSFFRPPSSFPRSSTHRSAHPGSPGLAGPGKIKMASSITAVICHSAPASPAQLDSPVYLQPLVYGRKIAL